MPINKHLIQKGLKAHSNCLDSLPQNCIIKFRAPSVIGSIELKSNLEIGAYSYFEKGRVGSLRVVGNYCSIAPGCVIGNGNHPIDYLTTHPLAFKAAGAFNFDKAVRDYSGGIERNVDVIKNAPEIGHDVWIGGNVTILRGVKIGNGAIVGANSLVNKDVPDYAIVAGSPAKLIRMRFDDTTIETLKNHPWFYHDVISLDNIPWSTPLKAAEHIWTAIDNKKIPTLDESRPFQIYRHETAQP